MRKRLCEPATRILAIVQVGGKIAQLGARLIDATSKQMADQFFNRFTNEVAGPPAATPGDRPAATAPDAARQPPEPAHAAAIRLRDLLPAKPFGLPRAAWAGIGFTLFGLSIGLLVRRGSR